MPSRPAVIGKGDSLVPLGGGAEAMRGKLMTRLVEGPVEAAKVETDHTGQLDTTWFTSESSAAALSAAAQAISEHPDWNIWLINAEESEDFWSVYVIYSVLS